MDDGNGGIDKKGLLGLDSIPSDLQRGRDLGVFERDRLKMMRMQTRCSAFGQEEHGEAGDEARWEMRPGGMLVQKREGPSPPAPTIRVRVKHGGASHEIYLSSQATFGRSNLKFNWSLIWLEFMSVNLDG